MSVAEIVTNAEICQQIFPCTETWPKQVITTTHV